MKCDEGVLNCENVRISTVAARFNEFIVSKLVGICEDTLLSQGVKPDEFSLELTPGTLEIPMILNRMAVSGKYNAFIALWAVIHGSTTTIIIYLMRCQRESWRRPYRRTSL